jgi:hypothetical protein
MNEGNNPEFSKMKGIDVGLVLADFAVDCDIGDVDHFVASSKRCFGSDEQYQLSTLDVLESDRRIALDHQLAAKNGLVYLVWGWKLALKPSLWQQWNRAFICFFIGLAVVSSLVYVTISTPHWSFYKLYLQPTAMVLWPAVCGGFLRYRTHCGSGFTDPAR